MARINLLPWREELRKEKTKEFGTLVGIFVVLAAIVVGLGHFYNVQRIERQTARNKYLEGQIAELDTGGSYLLYCRSGRRSAVAAERMAQAGFTDVVDAGGFQALADAGAPVE